MAGRLGQPAVYLVRHRTSPNLCRPLLEKNYFRSYLLAIFGYNTRLEYFPELNATVISTMSFNGYDFMVTNWYEDFCFPVIEEVRLARN